MNYSCFKISMPIRPVKYISYMLIVLIVLLSVSGCSVKNGYIKDDSEKPEMQWLTEELQMVCSDVEFVASFERVINIPHKDIPALVVKFSDVISEEQAEKVLERLLQEFDNPQLLNVLIDEGWFVAPYDYAIVFYSSGGWSDYAFELLGYYDYQILVGSSLLWPNNRCFNEQKWELSEYTDIDSYLDYIGF